jgi:lysyl-tRNA synthetase class 2
MEGATDGAPAAIEGGEPMSKSALKKLEKAKKAAEEKRIKEEKKKAEAATAPKKAKAQQGEDDEDMDPTQYRSNRLRVLGELKEKAKNPYPHKFETSISIPKYIEKFGEIKDGEHLEGEDQSVAG